MTFVSGANPTSTVVRGAMMVDAFSIALDKIKAADHAVRDARAAYGWESKPEAEEGEA